MKNLAVLLLFFTVPALAQNGHPGSVYGTVVSKIATVRNTTALFVGGRGGWIFDHKFAVGIEGYMLLNNVKARIPDSSGNRYLTTDYGGVDLEYFVSVGDRYYLTVQTLIGGGSIGHKEIPYLDRRQYHDPFLVLEPSAGLEAAVREFSELELASAIGKWRF
jgi:hypothetical protein